VNKTNSHNVIAQTNNISNNNNPSLIIKSSNNNLKNETGSIESLAYSDNEPLSYASANLNPSLSKYENTNDESCLRRGNSNSVSNEKHNNSYTTNITNNIINCQTASSLSELTDGGGGGAGANSMAVQNLSLNNNNNNNNINNVNSSPRGVVSTIGSSGGGKG
jgi:hypothetical protein